MDICLRVLKESNKSMFDSYSVRNSILIISHVTLRDCRAHIFSDNLSQNSCNIKHLTPTQLQVADPDLQIRGWGGLRCLKKTFLRPSDLSFRQKIRGCQGLSPTSATDSFMSNTVSLATYNHKWCARSNNCLGSLMLTEFFRGAWAVCSACLSHTRASLFKQCIKFLGSPLSQGFVPFWEPTVTFLVIHIYFTVRWLLLAASAAIL